MRPTIYNPEVTGDGPFPARLSLQMFKAGVALMCLDPDGNEVATLMMFGPDGSYKVPRAKVLLEDANIDTTFAQWDECGHIVLKWECRTEQQAAYQSEGW